MSTIVMVMGIWLTFGGAALLFLIPTAMRAEHHQHGSRVVCTDFVVNGQVVGSVPGLGRCKYDDDTVVVHRVYYAED